jgi:hypothetical protein
MTHSISIPFIKNGLDLHSIRSRNPIPTSFLEIPSSTTSNLKTPNPMLLSKTNKTLTKLDHLPIQPFQPPPLLHPTSSYLIKLPSIPNLPYISNSYAPIYHTSILFTFLTSPTPSSAPRTPKYHTFFISPLQLHLPRPDHPPSLIKSQPQSYSKTPLLLNPPIPYLLIPTTTPCLHIQIKNSFFQITHINQNYPSLQSLKYPLSTNLRIHPLFAAASIYSNPLPPIQTDQGASDSAGFLMKSDTLGNVNRGDPEQTKSEDTKRLNRERNIAI